MSEHEVKLTNEERPWHHKCICGIAAGLSLVVEHDTDCPFGQRLEAIIAARLADAEARAEAAEAKVRKWRRKCAEMAAARLRGDQ